MRTYLECIPCFLNQALKAMALSKQTDAEKEKVIKEIIRQLAKIDLNKKPPEFARLVYNIIYDASGNQDPYKRIKERDNKKARGIFPDIKDMADKSSDSLLAATKAAIAGNIMDFAAHSEYDIEHTISKVMKADLAIDDFSMFKKGLSDASSIAYLADNAGEIVLDKILLEQIRKLNDCPVYLYVKGKPIVNDATERDAIFAGLDKIEGLEIRKISTGFPNTGMKKESQEFNREMENIGMVISKGQGNYESLSDSGLNIYFLLIAKCSVIARDLGVSKGDIICKGNR